MKKILPVLALLVTTLTAAEVVCTTVQANIKKIRCKYMAIAQEVPREVTFNWTSPDNPADNRSKTHKIPAGHVSVYDDRYFSGRSEGRWSIDVVETDRSKVSTQYIKDSNAEVIRVRPEDPILKKIK